MSSSSSLSTAGAVSSSSGNTNAGDSKSQLQKIIQHREQGRVLERQLIASLYREVIQQDLATLCLFTSSSDQRLRSLTFECESLDYTRYKHDFAGVEANIFTFDIVLKASAIGAEAAPTSTTSTKSSASTSSSKDDGSMVKLHFHYELSNDDQVSIDSKMASINKTVVYQFTQKIDEYDLNDGDDGEDDEEDATTFAMTSAASGAGSNKPKKAANTDKDSEISDNGRILRKFLHKAVEVVTALSKDQYERRKR